MNEEELLDRSRAGDRGAFEALALPHRERIERYLATMTGDEREAEDLVQEALRKALVNLAGFEGRSKFSSWLYQIAVNLARNYMRDRASRASVQSPTSLDERARRTHCRRDVLSTILRGELAGALAGAIEDLPPTLREPFVLYHVERLPYDEIAEITGVAVGALQVRTHRARAFLRKSLGSIVETAWLEEGQK